MVAAQPLVVQQAPAEKFSRVTNITRNQPELGGVMLLNKKGDEPKRASFT